MNLRYAMAERLASVRARISAACERVSRDPAGVLLVGVSKRQPAERVATALELGVRDLGENYAQHLRQRRDAFAGVRWHFIGHLQRNKVRFVVPGCALLHSLDSVRLAEAVAKHATAAGVCQPVLLEVGTGEASKTGLPPAEVSALARLVQSRPSLRLEGLMGMAPWGGGDEVARRAFGAIRQLRDRLQDDLGQALPQLSMGMSGDLEVAVEQGATLVRVGEALFGPRP